MNTKHTAGKWIFRKYIDNSICIRKGQKGIVIAELTTQAQSMGIDENEAEANAKLIAAAPELLQMVFSLKECIERLTSDDYLTQYDKDTEAQWIGEAHELLTAINPDYYNNANKH